MLEILILNSLIIFAVYAMAGEGMIFGSLADRLRLILPIYICKPLFDCPPCMASFWGIVIYICLVNSNYLDLIIYLPTLCGANYIINTILNK
jgi:hypothetical protein